MRAPPRPRLASARLSLDTPLRLVAVLLAALEGCGQGTLGDLADATVSDDASHTTPDVPDVMVPDSATTDASLDAPAEASLDAPAEASLDAPAEASRDAPADVTTPRARVLAYLRSLEGRRTLSGIHNRHNNAPSQYTAMIHDVTGRYPALWSGDFLFDDYDPDHNVSNRAGMIRQAQLEWSHGAVVNLMFHACPPTNAEPCDWDHDLARHLSDAEWSDLITEGGTLNRAWLARLDTIVPYLRQLRDAGVAPLFRPIHEMNQGFFWWGGRPGPQGTRRLYQITHDHLVRHHGLDHMIWVWDVQDLSWNFSDYDPGTDHADIVALDVYGDGFRREKYDAIAAVANGRLMAIGECQVLPTAAELDAQPRWSFFMSWSELTFEARYNTGDAIRALYASPRVVTLDQTPGW